MGRHKLSPDRACLVYMPHCPKALYESFLSANFSEALSGRPGWVLLGNDLAEYLPGFVRAENESAEKEREETFDKPKKKRKGKGGAGDREPKDSVLQRLGPFLSYPRLTIR